jgi:AcrR family transcriptional regulator
MGASNKAKTNRGARTRRRLLEVTRQLLSESGPRSVTLDQVAARSKVAKTSILWHFGSKRELFLEALDEVIRDFESAFSARYPDQASPAEKLRLFFRDYAELMEKHPRLADVFFSFVFSDRSDEKTRKRARDLYRRYRTMVAAHISAALEDSREELAAVIVGLVDGVFIQWSLEHDALDPRAVFDAILSTSMVLEPAPTRSDTDSEVEDQSKGGE